MKAAVGLSAALTHWKRRDWIPFMETRLLYDRKEAARQLSISVRSLDYLIAGKQLDTRRIGKKVLVTHASLLRYASANHYEAVKEVMSESTAVLRDASSK